MKFKDNYSSEITELTVMKDGADILEDIVKDSAAMKSGYTLYDHNDNTYVMTTEQIEWWKRIALELSDDIAEAGRLSEKYGEVAVNKILAEELNDFSVSKLHSLYNKAFDRISDELGK